MKTSLLIVILMVVIGLYSCSKEETVITPPSSDTLSYSLNNQNDSIITINYAIGGSTTSQPVSWAANLMQNPLNIRFHSLIFTSGTGSSLTVQLGYDTLRRQAFTLSKVWDSTRNNITGPANKIHLIPVNFKGRGTITVYK
jgi:hypothetical protein